MKNKVWKIVLITSSVVVAIALISVIGVYSFLNFYLFPRMAGVKLSDLGIGITDVMTTITDKRVLDNIVNFDKQSATEVMIAMTELDMETEEIGAESSQSATNPPESGENPGTVSPVPAENSDSSGTAKPIGENQNKAPVTSGTIDTKGAYQRIMNSASKEEISQGMAIIAKVDIAKVTELRKSGDMSAVKAYVKSVLTADEISTAVTLYNKYKHLL